MATGWHGLGQQPGESNLVPSDRPKISNLKRRPGASPSTSIIKVPTPAPNYARGTTLRDRDLVGRDHLLERLENALLDRTLKSVFLAGSAGVGKTVVATALADRLLAQGFHVLRAQCHPGMPPLGMWHQFLNDAPEDQAAHVEEILRAHEQQLTAAQRGSAMARDVARSQLFLRLVRQVDAFVSKARCALVVDDLQWVDPDSIGLLEHVLRVQAGWSLVTTLNREAIDAPAVARAGELCLRLDRATVVELDVLNRQDVEQYLEHVLGAPAHDSWAQALHTRSGGNPLFLRELVQALLNSQVDLRAFASANPLDGILPPLLRELIQRRGAALSQLDSNIVQISAVLAGELDMRVLAELCAREHAEVLASLERLTLAGILQPIGTRPGYFRFVHGLVQDAFYEGLSVAQRASLHLRVGKYLAQHAEASAGPERVGLARHLRAALPLSDPREVVQACRMAARWTAAQGALSDAAQLYEQAFELAEQYGVGSARDRLVQALELGRACHACGFKDKTLNAYAKAISSARALGRHRVQVEAVLGHFAALTWGRHPNKSEERLLLEALSLVKSRSPLRARLLAQQAVLRGHQRISSAEVATAREAVELAAEYRDKLNQRAQRAWLDANRALHFVLQGPDTQQERAEVARRLLALEQIHGQSEHTYSVREILAGERLMCGDRAGYDALVAEARDRAARHPQFAWLYEVTSASAELMAGRWQEAEQRIRTAAWLGSISHNPQTKPVAIGHLFMMGRATGRVREVAGDMDKQLAGLGWLGDFPAAMRAAYFIEVGDTDNARSIFEPLVASWLEHPTANNDWLITATELAFIAIRLSDRVRGEKVAERLRPYAELHAVHPGVNYYSGPVARYLGLLAALDGRPRDGIEWLLRAQVACNAIGASAMHDVIVQELRQMQTECEEDPPVAPAPVPRSEAKGDVDSAQAGSAHAAALVRNGDSWLLRYNGKEVLTRDLIGFCYLAELIAQPHRSVKARTLVGFRIPLAQGLDSAAAASQALTAGDEDAGPALDHRALVAYRERLRQLDVELDEADAHCDAGRLERLQDEKEALRKELSRALDLFGKRRKAGARDERARVSCTRAIRKAIAYLAQHHPDAAEHLRISIRTGQECVYRPSPTVVWDCRR